MRGGDSIDAALATKAMELLGIRMVLDANPVGVADRRRQGDAVHAKCVSYVLRQLRRRGWAAIPEVEVGEGRYRGWIDILAGRPSDGALLVIEVKTETDDMGRLLRTLGSYVRNSRRAARERGWRVSDVTPVVLALATLEVDVRLQANRELLEVALPGDARTLAAWIEHADRSRPDGTIALIDPAGKGAAWLRRPRGVGRPAVLPYRDYRDAAVKLGA
jgi:hypothetical protein